MDHDCPGKAPPASRTNSVRTNWSRFFSGGGTWSQQSQKPAAGNSPGATKSKISSITRQANGSIQAQLKEYRSRHHNKQKDGSRGSREEACPECGLTFPSVQALLDHAAGSHEDGWRSGAQLSIAPPPDNSGSIGFEMCPQCGAQFADPVQLVCHVEQAHRIANNSASSETCVLC